MITEVDKLETVEVLIKCDDKLSETFRNTRYLEKPLQCFLFEKPLEGCLVIKGAEECLGQCKGIGGVRPV